LLVVGFDENVEMTQSRFHPQQSDETDGRAASDGPIPAVVGCRGPSACAGDAGNAADLRVGRRTLAFLPPEIQTITGVLASPDLTTGLAQPISFNSGETLAPTMSGNRAGV
jgi:hypothetical protein